MPRASAERVRLVRGDARRLPTVPDRSVALVVTSPPYPMIPQWDATFRSMGAGSYPAMLRVLADAWAACHRVLVPGGILAINIGDALRSDAGGFRLWPNQAETTRAATRVGFTPLPYLLWKKPTNKPNAFLGSGFLPPNAYVTLDCEFVLLFRKGRLRRFPPHDPARAASRYTRAERDVWFSQIWSDVRGARQAGAAGRTGAFPPEVPARLIRMFSVVGDTVLDPFAGTGTTVWAAARLGRRAIGIERDPATFRALVATGRAWGLVPAPRRPPPRGRSAGRGARAPRRRPGSGTEAPSR
ncbi:MAG TPA: site-specific DNA-methyltransferase [Thermoplasmata archaeon]|nr:site-specific DNA-methyltransferase [Thermoplasmata archaeon]